MQKRMERFVIPYPRNKSQFCKRYGLNSYWAGKHWSQRKRDADDLHQIVTAALIAAKIPRRLFSAPVRITFYHNTRMDVDNHAGIEKIIVDALKGWLLQDDDRRYYRERVSRYHDRDYIGVVVEQI